MSLVAKHIDLNADIGEGFETDHELMDIVTSVNVCLGHHAGSSDLTKSTVERAKKKGLNVGMHPGFPHRKSLGRELPLSESQTEEWIADVLEQLDVRLSFDYIKPHGALFHATSQGNNDLDSFWEKVRNCDLPFLGMANTNHQTKCKELGIQFVREGYCERRYDSNGQLVPRSSPDAEIHDLQEICAQALALADRVDSICIHGDRPDCVRIARSVCVHLEENGFIVRRFALK